MCGASTENGITSNEFGAESRASEPKPTGVQPGCLLAGGAFVLGALLVVLVMSVLMRRGDGGVDLGVAAGYAPGSVVYRSTDELFVVRLPGGQVVAYSDRDPHNPPGRDDCRVTWRPELGEGSNTAQGGTAPGRFFDICTGSLYDLEGRGLRGDDKHLAPIRIEEQEDGRLRAYPSR